MDFIVLKKLFKNSIVGCLIISTRTKNTSQVNPLKSNLFFFAETGLVRGPEICCFDLKCSLGGKEPHKSSVCTIANLSNEVK